MCNVVDAYTPANHYPELRIALSFRLQKSKACLELIGSS
jgi:hypothetical protein